MGLIGAAPYSAACFDLLAQFEGNRPRNRNRVAIALLAVAGGMAQSGARMQRTQGTSCKNALKTLFTFRGPFRSACAFPRRFVNLATSNAAAPCILLRGNRRSITSSDVMKRRFFWLGGFLTIVCTMFAQDRSPSPGPLDFDVIIKDGTVYDGTGAEPKQADVAIRGDRIAGVGDFKTAKANTIIDARDSPSRLGLSICFPGPPCR